MTPAELTDRAVALLKADGFKVQPFQRRMMTKIFEGRMVVLDPGRKSAGYRMIQRYMAVTLAEDGKAF